MKSKREQSSACFPLSLHTFKEKKVGGGETGVVNNSSLFYHQKLYLSANKQQKRPDKSSHFSLLSPSSGWGANEKKSVRGGESEEKPMF